MADWHKSLNDARKGLALLEQARAELNALSDAATAEIAQYLRMGSDVDIDPDAIRAMNTKTHLRISNGWCIIRVVQEKSTQALNACPLRLREIAQDAARHLSPLPVRHAQTQAGVLLGKGRCGGVFLSPSGRIRFRLRCAIEWHYFT